MIVRPVSKRTACSTMPSTSAAPNVTGRLSIRPITAAAKRAEHEARPEDGPDVHALDREPEEHAEPGHAGGDHPHERADALDRDAEERGAVGRLGLRADGDTDVGEAEERDEPEPSRSGRR